MLEEVQGRKNEEYYEESALKRPICFMRPTEKEHEGSIDYALKRFTRLNPPHFSSCMEDRAGEKWINQSAILGRVFALSKEEAKASSKLIRGTIFLGDTKIPALFDSGATYSFISNECVEKLKLLVIDLPVLMNVSTLAGASSVKTIRAYLKVKMRFGYSITLIDLVYLPMLGIDVIVGIDWLSANSLRILPPIVNLEIPMFLSAMQIKRSDYEGCQMFLVFFSAFGEYDGTLDEIGVVSEFLKVFADEMSSLPLVREIEFFINLVPRTEPISRAPYWMAPSKLEELKKQLEELLEKGFIRLSVSP
ncbi:uncharacterized protein LOC129301501 [Prosopis cineraria]|uniref:uncharacterized protein LOC129301501 n=1 Tax=Prosopis cineraria TaxID=364024 RepID=UPI00240EA497|nr:uncharacterized protein LOC129301501 [Prosopis cineraria]